MYQPQPSRNFTKSATANYKDPKTSTSRNSKSRETSSPKVDPKQLRAVLLDTLHLLRDTENIDPNHNKLSSMSLLSLAQAVHRKVANRLEPVNCRMFQSNSGAKQPKQNERKRTYNTQRSVYQVNSQVSQQSKCGKGRAQIQSQNSSQDLSATGGRQSSSLLNSSIAANRSNILHYFKQKFGNPLENSEMPRNLRALEVIKKSQQISRYHSKSIDSFEANEESAIKQMKNQVIVQKLQSKLRF